MRDRSSSFADGKSRVLEAVDIVKLIGETVQLKRAGRRYSGLCPFHNEKSPSFSVDPAKQFFYCFGCKKGGNAIDFVIERDRLAFIDALESLAEWAGVELPRFEKNPEHLDKRKRMLDAHSEVADLFRRLLQGPEGKDALDYLHGRGFDDATIKRFGLGFAPDSWDTLARHGLLRKYPAPLLEEAGLLKRRERGDGFYDTFRARVIFPIRDEQGRPIAFGGRILPGDDNPAKYLNSPETPLFSKGHVLYGLDAAKKRMVETRTAVVFEGYADATMAHQFGITNAVAVLGTALTPEHAKVLRRLADKIVLLFDADAAGGIAARRSVELFLREPVEIAVAELPEGKDPDEFLQTHGAEALQKVIDEAVDALTFEWRQVNMRLGADNSVTGRQRALEEYLRRLGEAKGSGPVDSLRWGAVLARVERLTGLKAEDLNRRFGQTKPPSTPAGRPPQTAAGQRQNGQWPPFQRSFTPGGSGRGKWREKPKYTGPRRGELGIAGGESASSRAEAQLLGALFVDPHLWHQVQAHASPDDFADRRYRWLADRFWELLRNEGEPTFPEWLDHLSLAAGERPGAAERAKAMCIELCDAAEQLGSGVNDAVDVRPVAAAAVQFFLKRRGGNQLEALLGQARMRQPSEAQTPEADDEKLLRMLEAQLRAAGRA